MIGTLMVNKDNNFEAEGKFCYFSIFSSFYFFVHFLFLIPDRQNERKKEKDLPEE